jgi:N-methylhydantoinase A
MTGYRIGVDIGGTFTDIVLIDSDGMLYSKKILSTPDDYSRAIEEGTVALLGETGVNAGDIKEFAHGTTVATNTIIERKGVKVGLVTTKGFRDVLELGRFRSPHLYDINFRKPEPLVERRFRFEVDERVDGRGKVLKQLDTQELDTIADQLQAANVEAIAICFLNSYVNSAHEFKAQHYLQTKLPNIPVSASVQLLPQIQEFERTSTTVVNAYIRPVVEQYMISLSNRMRRIGICVPIMIMHSSGGVMRADMAGANPVYIIESGPAAGVVGAHRLGRRLGLDDLMILDMGGTTAKASLIQDGRFTIMPESEVGDGNAGHRLVQGGGYAIQVPTIDIAEVGAGGGSIAEVDSSGGFKVGPRSAGAVPGPVCYGLGGENPTVTDANVILGYFNPQALVGGGLTLEKNRAEDSIDLLSKRIDQKSIETAYGIHQIANANMIRALKGVSSERGSDPSKFTLVAIGGNGGAHAAGLAEQMDIKRILVPPVAGLFSALGLLFADVEHQVVTGLYRELSTISHENFNTVLEPMIAEAKLLLSEEGFDKNDSQDIEIFADLRYVGQTWTLGVKFPAFPADDSTFDELKARFGDLHEQNYGYRSDSERLQCVAIKVIGRGRSEFSRMPEHIVRGHEKISQSGHRNAFFGAGLGWRETRVLPRIELPTVALEGPLIIEEYDTTTVVRPGWRAFRDNRNNIVMERD